MAGRVMCEEAVTGADWEVSIEARHLFAILCLSDELHYVELCYLSSM